MTSSETSPDLGTTSGLPLRRRKRKDYSLLVLAAGLLLFAAAAGALYFALRPVTIREAERTTREQVQIEGRLVQSAGLSDGVAET